ncbi:MAG: DNA-processing protein DprA [Acidobacteria bacterium]|nr:DNA-processing protein DprA [Acidobacteriota bacterium]
MNTLNLLMLLMIPGLGKRKLLEIVQEAPFLLCDPVDRHFWLYLGKKSRQPMSSREAGTCQATARQIEERISSGEFSLVHLFAPGYPAILRQIYDPPLALFLKGRTELLHHPCLAIVGARQATDYGVAIAETLAARLAETGLVIVAGMAKGIDSAAHVGSLKSGGGTIAVLGSGVDVAYPSQARRLYQRLCTVGCVVSEFLPGSRPNPQNFPLRNRIISGLSVGTVIVEASQHSGSLITARLTMEQNRELYAVPGPVHSPYSIGTNYLIKQGAKLVQIWQDVVEDLPLHIQERLQWRPASDSAGGEVSPPFGSAGQKLKLTTEQETVYNLLLFERKTHLDTLLDKTGLGFGQLGRVILELITRELIIELPGQYYLKNVR